ncbi:MAG: TonB-dependent receptor [Bacteroidota bacterium]|nr:TonB-dependent receptor [Bacteroidota bacterium]
MKRLILFFSIITTTLFAQNPRTSSSYSSTPLAGGTIKGKVIDASSNQPMEYTTVALYSVKDSALITGTISTPDGTFTISSVRLGRYYLILNFIGFQKRTIKDLQITQNQKNIDLGVIKLTPSGHTLQEVSVVGTQTDVQYKIDKKIVRVGQDISSKSGSAIDVLENVPSVNVDIDGNITIRGSSSFTVLIDGRPSVLEGSDALKQIPATAIDNIEIITNPSAKYDPQGVSGIINVNLKKDVNLGITGIINTSIGTGDKYRSDATFNYNVGKFNFILSGNYSNTRNRSTTDNLKETTRNDTTKIVSTDGIQYRKQITKTLRGGFDYKMDKKNILSLLIGIGQNAFNREFNSTDTLYYNPTGPRKVSQNTNTADAKTNFYNLNLNYQHKFNEKGHELNTLLYYAKRDGKNNNVQNENITDYTGYPAPPIAQNTYSKETSPDKDFRIKVDYSLPMEKDKKLEAGYQSEFETDNEDYSFYNGLPGQGILDDKYTSSSKYLQDIHAIYSTFAGKIDKLQYQFGLRGEYNYRKIEHTKAMTPYKIDRFDLFPTLHLSLDAAPTIQTLLSYTRRVQRPRNYNLDPFPIFIDPNNIQQGNPALKPEFVDSYEFSVIKKINKSFLSFETYYRVNHDLITRVLKPNSEGIFINTFENLNKSFTFGAEMMADIDMTQWLKTTLTADLYNYKLKGSVVGDIVDKNSTNYNFRLNTTIRMSADSKLQIIGLYRGPSVTAQGTSKEMFGLNVAAQQDFCKRKLSATLQIRDLLGTMKRDFTSFGTNFKTTSKNRMEKRVITLTLSYKFNNYKPEKKKTEEEEAPTEAPEEN